MVEDRSQISVHLVYHIYTNFTGIKDDRSFDYVLLFSNRTVFNPIRRTNMGTIIPSLLTD